MTARADIRPLLLGEADAARYLGIGATTLAKIRKDGRIRRRVWGRLRLYDVRDLDALANELPYEGEDGDKVNAWLDANG